MPFDNSMNIKSIHARQIFDSRGNPTVEVDLTTEKGIFRAAVPSGVSTGSYEALELRDNIKTEYLGKGVRTAVNNINDIISPALIKENLQVTDQCGIDNFMVRMDGTENKSKFGANSILAISMAVCRAGAAHKGVPLYRHIADLAGTPEIILPVPAFNVISGSLYHNNRVMPDINMILPTGASSFEEAMRMGLETCHHLKKIVNTRFGSNTATVRDYDVQIGSNILNNEDTLALITESISKAGYTGKIEIGIDIAASEYYKQGKYDFDSKNPQSDPSTYLDPKQLVALYQGWTKKFPIVSIEDPFDQDDWAAWTHMTANTNIQIVSDDLTASNTKRITMAIDRKACNCLLLKVNQIGSVTESIAAHKLANSNGWGTMVSHRSGETEDTFIADLAVGLSTGQIKSGALRHSDRFAKYNQILRIEGELGAAARFAGKNFRNPLLKIRQAA